MSLFPPSNPFINHPLLTNPPPPPVRSDGTSLKELPKLQPRPPFTLHDYSPKHAWITPLDEYSTFSSLLETAYERAKVEYPDGEGRMRAEGVGYMWEYVLNPDYGEIDEEEMDIIDER